MSDQLIMRPVLRLPALTNVKIPLATSPLVHIRPAKHNSTHSDGHNRHKNLRTKGEQSKMNHHARYKFQFWLVLPGYIGFDLSVHQSE